MQHVDRQQLVIGGVMDIDFDDGGIHAKATPPNDCLAGEPGRVGQVDGGHALGAKPTTPIGQCGRMRQRVRRPEVAEPPPMKTFGHFLDQHAIRKLVAISG